MYDSNQNEMSWYMIPGIWGHWRKPCEVWPLFVYLMRDFKTEEL
jgi:hypothetical protein